MEESSFNEDQRIVQEIAGRFDAPAFMRRAKRVETSWALLLEQLAGVRQEKLEFVRLRLGQLFALAGSWEALRPWLPHDEDRAGLQRLHTELQPRLRLPLEPTTSPRVLRSALRELVEAMESFNQRWQKQLAQTDLKPVNDAREAYNRFYLVEKECALGSARVARIGYQRLAFVSQDEVRALFPLLNVPRVMS